MAASCWPDVRSSVDPLLVCIVLIGFGFNYVVLLRFPRDSRLTYLVDAKLLWFGTLPQRERTNVSVLSSSSFRF